MILQYAITLEDVVAFNEHFAFTHNRHSARRMWLRALSYAAMCGVPIAWVLHRDTHDTGVAIAVCAAIMVVLVIPYHRYLRHYLRRQIRGLYGSRSEDGTIGSHTLEGLSNGIKESTANTQSFHEWSAVQAIALTPSHLFIYLGTPLAHIVPRKAVTPEFLSFLRSNLPVTSFEESK